MRHKMSSVICMKRRAKFLSVYREKNSLHSYKKKKEKDEMTTYDLLQHPNIPIAYPGESMFGPSPYNSSTTGSGTLVFQVARQHSSAGLLLRKVACMLDWLLSDSDTHINSLFCCRHIFCYSLM